LTSFGMGQARSGSATGEQGVRLSFAIATG
jgi:hypothetical protein